MNIPKTSLWRAGKIGTAFGLFTLLTCELPILLALVGLGGLSQIAAQLRPNANLELLGIVVGSLGISLILFLAVNQIRKKADV